jgi:hypothetical protein
MRFFKEWNPQVNDALFQCIIMRDKLRRLPSSKKVKQAQGKKSQEQYIFFMNGNIFSSTQTICYWVKMEDIYLRLFQRGNHQAPPSPNSSSRVKI